MVASKQQQTDRRHPTKQNQNEYSLNSNSQPNLEQHSLGKAMV